MSTIADSDDSRLAAFVSRHPVVGTVVLAIGPAVGAGIVAFAYVTGLDRLGFGLHPDALAVAGILAVFLLVSGVVVHSFRQNAALEDGLQALTHTVQSGELELQKQTKMLEAGVAALEERNRIQRAIHTPSIEIEQPCSVSGDSPDTIQFDITRAGAITDLTLHSDVELVGAPEEYSVRGERAVCPLSRIEHGTVETDVRIGVEDTDRTVCGLSDAMQVFSVDGVDAIELTLEFTYTDVFDDEHTERVHHSTIDLSDAPTATDVLNGAEPVETTIVG